MLIKRDWLYTRTRIFHDMEFFFSENILILSIFIIIEMGSIVCQNQTINKHLTFSQNLCVFDLTHLFSTRDFYRDRWLYSLQIEKTIIPLMNDTVNESVLIVNIINGKYCKSHTKTVIRQFLCIFRQRLKPVSNLFLLF